MSASPDRGNGRNPDAERPDNGQMEHSFPPSQKTINPGSSTNGTHVGESSQDTSQREYSVRRYDFPLSKVVISGMSYKESQEYLARSQKQQDNAEMDLDGEYSQTSSTADEEDTQSTPEVSQEWTTVDMYRHRKLSLKIRVSDLKKGTHQEQLQDVLWTVTSMRANLVSTPVRFRYRGEEYYQVTPVGKDDYENLADIICDSEPPCDTIESGSPILENSQFEVHALFTPWNPQQAKIDALDRTMELYGISPLVDMTLLKLAIGKFGEVESQTKLVPAAKGMQMRMTVEYKSAEAVEAIRATKLRYINVERDLVRIGSLAGERYTWDKEQVSMLIGLPQNTSPLDLVNAL